MPKKRKIEGKDRNDRIVGGEVGVKIQMIKGGVERMDRNGRNWTER